MKEAFGGTPELMIKAAKLTGKGIGSSFKWSQSKYSAAKAGAMNIWKGIETLMDESKSGREAGDPYDIPVPKILSEEGVISQTGSKISEKIATKARGIVSGYPKATKEQQVKIEEKRKYYFAKNKDGSYKNPVNMNYQATKEERQVAFDTWVKGMVLGGVKEAKVPEKLTAELGETQGTIEELVEEYRKSAEQSGATTILAQENEGQY